MNDNNMTLEKLINIRGNFQKKQGISEERLQGAIDAARDIISYWREYPDMFVDYLCSLNPENTFKFYPYQRIFLRAVMRHRHAYCTFPRALILAPISFL